MDWQPMDDQHQARLEKFVREQCAATNFQHLRITGDIGASCLCPRCDMDRLSAEVSQFQRTNDQAQEAFTRSLARAEQAESAIPTIIDAAIRIERNRVREWAESELANRDAPSSHAKAQRIILRRLIETLAPPRPEGA